MRAAVFHAFGDADVLSCEDIPTPEPRPGNVLIKVLAAGVNRLDHYIRAGEVAPDLAFPHVLGMDAAGEIAKVGAGVTDFAAGDRVVPFPGYPANGEEAAVSPVSAARSVTLLGLAVPGTYAQYVEAPAAFVMRDYSELPPEEVATLPVVLTTAVRAVKTVGEVQAGQKVLVHGASSGVGSMEVQVAKALGAEVAATVRSDEKAALPRSLGADVIINTQHENVADSTATWTDGEGVDAVIDNLGGTGFADNLNALRPQGILVTVGFAAGLDVACNVRDFFFAQKQIRGTLLGDPADYLWGVSQIRAGTIRPSVDRALPLREAGEAHRLIAAGRVNGNLVLLPWAE